MLVEFSSQHGHHDDGRDLRGVLDDSSLVDLLLEAERRLRAPLPLDVDEPTTRLDNSSQTYCQLVVTISTETATLVRYNGIFLVVLSTKY